MSASSAGHGGALSVQDEKLASPADAGDESDGAPLDPQTVETYSIAFRELSADVRKAFIGRLERSRTYEHIAATLGSGTPQVGRDACGDAVSQLLASVAPSSEFDSRRLSDLLAGDATDGTPAELELVAMLRALQREMVPTRWGKLTVIGAIDSGGFGTIYRAWDPDLERLVALKLYHPERARRPKAELLDEARQLAKVRHPNVVTVYNAEEHDGEVGVWMELIDGDTLEAETRQGRRLDTKEACDVGIALCDALGAVHAAGIVHGDVKAHNVMRAKDGRIVLMDFGAARTLEPGRGDAGRTAGTPAYMAPERFQDPRPTVRSDIYAVGVMLFYLVSGRYPVEGDSLHAIREAHLSATAMLTLADLRPDLEERLVVIIEQASSRSPGQRPASAGDMRDALQAARPNTARLITFQRAARTAGWVIGCTASLFALGRLAARSFEVALSIGEAFARPSARYLSTGANVAAPLFLMCALAAVLLVVLLAVYTPVRWRVDPLLRRFTQVVARFDPKLVATSIFFIGAICLGAIVSFLFLDIFNAADTLRLEGPGAPSVRATLGPASKFDHYLLGASSGMLSLVLLLSAWRWFPELGRRVGNAFVVRVMKWATLLVAFLSVALVAIVWPLTWEHFSTVEFRGNTWHVVGESENELLLYDPCDGTRLLVPREPTPGGLVRTGTQQRLFETECEAK